LQSILGKTLCFTLDDDPSIIVCAFTISNDSIKARDLPNSIKRKVTKLIPREKTLRNYPAILIGRLGVNIKYRGYNRKPGTYEFYKILVYRFKK